MTSETQGVDRTEQETEPDVDLRDHLDEMEYDEARLKTRREDSIIVGDELDKILRKSRLAPYEVVVGAVLTGVGHDDFVTAHRKDFERIEEAVEHFNGLEVTSVSLDVEFKQ